MSKELGDKHAELEQQMYKLAGKSLILVARHSYLKYYCKLQLPTAGIKKGKTGYSTGQKNLINSAAKPDY